MARLGRIAIFAAVLLTATAVMLHRVMRQENAALKILSPGELAAPAAFHQTRVLVSSTTMSILPEGIEVASGPEEPPRAEPFLGRELGQSQNRQKAAAAMREFALMRSAVESAAGKAPAVAIRGRTAPVLAEENGEMGYPIDSQETK